MDQFKIYQVERKLENELNKLTKLLPTHLQQQFSESAFISGGCIYSLYNDQEPKDYDFFLTDTSLVQKVRDYFNSIPNLQDKDYLKLGFYKNKKLIITDNAISIGNYQIITKWSGDIENVVREFDFLHNFFYYYNGRIKTLTKWEYLEDNKLRYNVDRARDISGTICRTAKFAKRGFEVSQREIAKMLLRLNEVGFNERELEILNSHDRDFDS